MPGPAPPPHSPGGARGDALLGLVLPAPAGLRLEGRSLAAHAIEALRAVRGVDVRVLGPDAGGAPGLDPGARWADLAAGGLILHDAHCPLLPGSALRAAVQLVAAATSTSAIVGVRPVTDTLKQVVDGAVAGTVDRDALLALASPVVVGPETIDELAERLPLAGHVADLVSVVRALAQLGQVLAFEVPSNGRRLSDAADVVLAESLLSVR